VVDGPTLREVEIAMMAMAAIDSFEAFAARVVAALDAARSTLKTTAGVMPGCWCPGGREVYGHTIACMNIERVYSEAKTIANAPRVPTDS